jgi:anti-anti-sigma factor
MEIKVNSTAKRARIALRGQVDETGAIMLKNQVKNLKFDELQELVFDFAEVERIGSAGIGQLLLAYKHLAGGGGVMRLEGVSPTLGRLFQNLKLDTLFSIKTA